MFSFNVVPILLPSLLSSLLLLLLSFAPLAQAAPFNESWIDFNINTNTGKSESEVAS